MFCGEQGLVRYWHIGNKRNANAIVARTEDKRKKEMQQKTKRLVHLDGLFQSFSVSFNGAANDLYSLNHRCSKEAFSPVFNY